MKVIDVVMSYYEAESVAKERPRHAAKVSLTCTTDAGTVDYVWAVSFFPHDAEDDFAVSYDAETSRSIYNAKGRRAKKREGEFLEQRESVCDELAAEFEGKIFWDKPLIEARLG